MNRIYRLCWNRASGQWVPASELANRDAHVGVSRKRIVGRRALMLSVLATSMCAAGAAYAGGGGPTGGQITSGLGQIQQVGNTTTIRQSSPTLTLNWQSFNIAPNQTVDFLQPGSSAIAVNRIFSSTPSEIYGHLNANGQVWLINPNGILFGQSAQVNVGGLVASTLDLDDSTLFSDSRHFSGSGKGSVINQGAITAANGGYVALLGNQVSNQGVIRAQLGTVALGGGSAATLTFDGNQLLHVQVDQSTLNNLVENRQLIVANGGQVIMTAGAKNALLASTVNNTGVVQAQTVENHNGVITLFGGMTAGSVNVGGTLDASAPNGGAGGSIETSAANFNVASNAHITAAAPYGKAGTWLVDPTDLNIDVTAASTIVATLNSGTNVTEQTTATGASGAGTQAPGAGDINVNSPIIWTNTAANLTLSAYNAVNVNATISGSGGITLVTTNNAATGAGININAAVTSNTAVSMSSVNGNLTIGSGGSIAGATGVTLATTSNFVNLVGAGAVASSGGHWLIYSTDPTLDTDGGLTPDFIQYNAPYQTAPAVANKNGFLYSFAPQLTITGLTGTVSKVYNNSNAAALTGTNIQSTGLYNGDQIVAVNGTYATSNAGTNIAVTSPATIGGFTFTDSTGTIPVYGYTLVGARASANIGTITPAQLSATIVGNPTKVYDGTTTATLNSSNYQFTGFVAGQGATVNQPSSVAFASSGAGTETINATFSSPNFIANSGTNLNNYILPTSATGTGTITQAPLLIRGLASTNKVYDATTNDPLITGGTSLYGVIGSDNVTLDTSGAMGTFASPNVGNNLAVSITGFVLTGAQALDYKLIQPSGFTANITPKALTISNVTASNKVYDGTTSDLLNDGSATLNGVIGTDNVTLSTSGATGTFSQSDVGNSLGVTANGFTLTGTAAGNYTVAQPSGLTANITPAPLSISITGNPTKTYDGTAATTLTNSNFSITGFVTGQGATLPQTSSATYSTPNAGNNLGVTVNLEASDFSPTGNTSLSNYTFPSVVTGTGTISPLLLTASIVGNPTKVYDGNTSATLNSSNYSLSGFVGSDNITITQTSGTYASPNAGTEPVSASITAGDYTAVGGTILSNYIVPSTINGFGTITPAPVSMTIVASINGPTRVYDGTTNASIPASDFTLSGFVPGQGATVNQTISGQFASPNVGSQPVSATMIQADFTANAGTNLNNYSFPITAYGTGSITPALLTVSIINNPTKVYDGTTNASVLAGNFQISGFVTGEGASITPTTSFSYSSPNAGTSTVTGTLTSNNYNPDAGTLMSNYTIATTASGLGTITQAPLFITGVYATDKVYDRSTSDTLNIGAAALAGLVTSDVGNVTLNTSTTGTFSQVNAGNNLSVTASGFSISGSAASNYTLQPITGLFANITKAPLTLSGVLATDKSYDGTTTDSLDVSGASVSGVIGGDLVSVSATGAIGQFSSPNVGNGLSVSTSGFTVTGNQASNYFVVQPGGLSANIIPAILTAVITGNPTKAYDGSNSATLTAGDYTLVGFAPGQGASIPQSATANYVTANAGTNVGVQSTLVSSDFLANPGTNLANYVLPTTGAGTGTITPFVLNLTGQRVYNGLDDANGNLFGTLTGLHGDKLVVNGSGTSSAPDVGTYTSTSGNFDNSGLSLAAASGNTAIASNYTLVNGADRFTITPFVLSFTGTRVYNGTTTASGSDLIGTISGLNGDTFTLTNTGTTSSKNVGTYTLNHSGGNGALALGSLKLVSAGQGNASDYTLVGGSDVFTITPLTISLNAIANNKTYDSTTSATLSSLTGNGVIAGDNITFHDTGVAFTDPNAGTGKQVDVTGITATGADAGNYVFANSTTTTANITPALITLTSSRVYDAGTDANASLFTTGGQIATGVAGQTLSLTGSGVLNSKNVGAEGFQSLGTLALGNGTGPNAGAAGNYVFAPIANDSVAVTPLAITVTATADNKVYDGTTNVTLSSLGSTGVLAGDNVNFNDTNQAFVSPNANNGVQVNVSGIGATGTDASNYTFNTSTTTNANITPKPLVLTSTRVYNGTTSADANLFTTGGQLATGIGGQTLVLTGSGVLVTKNVGSQRAFQSLGSLAIADGTGGGLASNYTLSPITNDWVTITPLAITVGATGSNKTYDGNTTATVALGSNGILPGDQVNFSDGSANFSTPNAGNGISIAVSGIAGSGADVGNYTFNTSTTTSANITPVIINLTGTRVYDANTDANANLFGNNGVVAGINGQTLNLTGNGVLTSKNVNPAQIFASLGTLTLNNGSGLASNYTLVGGTDLVAITPAILTVTGTMTTNRVYDGTTLDTLSGSALTGVLGNDNVTLGNDGIGNFDTKNVGNNKPVTTAMTVSGSDASNYILVQPTGLTANITPLPITITATGTNRPYNGTTTDVVTLNSTGVLGGDQLGFNYGAANFDTPFVGNGKPVTVTGMTLTGADAENYVLTSPTTITSANITNVGYAGTGVDGGWIAQLQSNLYPSPIATPYGAAEANTVGVYTGNHKLLHKPIERNRIRSDFHSGMPLQVLGNGVSLPTDASP